MVVTKKGYGKRTSVSEYKTQTRGGKGMLTYDKSKFKKTGELIGATTVEADDEIMLINSNGVIIRIRAKEVSQSGRTTQGVKIMKVVKGDKIVSFAKVVDDEEAAKKPTSRKNKKKDKSSDNQMTISDVTENEEN
jgi:DNA gyrase subunit A